MLAVALLIGFVVLGMLSVALVGSVTLDRAQDNAQNQRIEMVFVEFSQSVTSVAFGQGTTERVDFDIRANDAAVRHDETGRIRVYTDDTLIANRTFGSVEYTREGSTVAYQAGGVWRGTGQDATMVSPPPFEYADGSLNAWIPLVTGERTLTASGIDLRRNGTGQALDRQSVVQGQLVTVEIQSKYYGGWADYLRQQTNDVSITVDHENETVVMRLGEPAIDSTFSEGVYATGGDVQFDGGSAVIDGDVSAGGNVSDHSRVTGNVTEGATNDLRILDDVIEKKVRDAENDTTMPVMHPEVYGASLSGGETYYDDDGFVLENGDDLTVDLSAGNVTMIVDGNISLEGGNIEIENGGDNRAFRIYSTGNFGMGNSQVGVVDESQYFQLYGTSEMQVAITGGSQAELYGTIFAPREEPVLGDNESNAAAEPFGTGSKCDGWDTCIVAGSSEVSGAIIAGPTIVGQSTEVVYDQDLVDIQPSLQLEHGLYPPPITYLHLSVYEISVSQAGSNSSVAGPPVGPSSVELAAEPRARAA
ncbi:hypothetical protein ACFSBL_07385 [Haloarchaeobius litoreus]|uniref:DUF7305 domain-containing protein n=1 Tax=Haloarchaeobius litoreus TaxID=755306 RepID=A0ABD6DGS1_9EURY